MGDAGSEWGMGGFEKSHYFYTKWPDHMWEAVQRRKSSSSLHMEALQVLVAARAMGTTWASTDATMRLDCLALPRAHTAQGLPPARCGKRHRAGALRPSY
jgi:hypothetical protein